MNKIRRLDQDQPAAVRLLRQEQSRLQQPRFITALVVPAGLQLNPALLSVSMRRALGLAQPHPALPAHPRPLPSSPGGRGRCSAPHQAAWSRWAVPAALPPHPTASPCSGKAKAKADGSCMGAVNWISLQIREHGERKGNLPREDPGSGVAQEGAQ